jgi:hypothetical protein
MAWRHASRNALLIVAAATLLNTVTPIAAQADTPPTATATVAPTDSQSAPNEVTAGQIAMTYGHPVTVSADTTETNLVQAEPDGSFQLTESSIPVRVRQSGAWVPVDVNLAPTADGFLTPKASTAPVEFSPGGSGPMARFQDAAGTWIAVSWPGGSLPAPAVSGSTATYSNVFPGVNLVLTASPQGMTEVLVITSAVAAADSQLSSLTFAISGTTLSGTSNGTNATATAADGAISPEPAWWDSSSPGSGPAGPGINAQGRPVPDKVAANSITINAASAISATAVTYPAYIDPETVLKNKLNYTYVDVRYPTQSYYDNTSFEHVGYVTSSDGTHVARSFWQMDLSGLAGKYIASSTFNATDEWSYSCTPEVVTLYWTGGIASNTDWNNQPGSIGAALSNKTIAYQNPSFPGGNPNTACPTPSTPTSFTATAAVAQSLANGANNVTLGLYTNEANAYYWKQFSDGATLTVSYYSYPTAPAGRSMTPCAFQCASPATVGSLNPTLTGTATDSDGYNLNYNYQVWAGSSSSPTTLVWSGTVANVQSGKGSAINTGTLANGSTYEYRVQACVNPDTAVCGGWSVGWPVFTVDASPPLPPSLTATCSSPPCLSQSANSFSGTVGTTSEQVTISEQSGGDKAWGYAYAIAPMGVSAAFPTNLVCNTSVNGYTTVCPGSVGASSTVTITAPADTSTFSAETFNAAGIASTTTATISFYAGGDYNSSANGHSWQTDSYDGVSQPCETGGIPDSATTSPQNLSQSGDVCWSSDSTAPNDNGLANPTSGVLNFPSSAIASTATTTSGVIDPSQNTTVAGWLKPTTTIGSGQWETAVSQSGTNESLLYLQDTQGHFGLCLASTDATSFAGDCVTDPNTAAVGQWTFVAGVYDAADHELLLYTSTSDSIGTPTIATHVSTPATSGPVTIGQDHMGSAYHYWQGNILDPAIWNGVADSGQLQQLADLTAPAYFTPPILGS